MSTNERTVIANCEYEGERPLFRLHHLDLRGVTVHEGESALKEGVGLLAEHCRFEGKYPFWHNEDLTMRHCHFTAGARAALWYCRNVAMSDSRVDAPKLFRDMGDILLEDVHFTDAAETLWNCSGIRLRRVQVEKGDYLFMGSRNIDIDGLHLDGKYTFQYCRDVVIRNSVINSRDAFWNTENITVYDSVIHGAYLGWHSHNLRLVRCRVGGTQPLCYAHNLVMEDCTMDEDGDLAFEYSSVQADIRGHVHSIKNPRTGSIVADSIGALILDPYIKAPADCRIRLRDGSLPPSRTL